MGEPSLDTAPVAAAAPMGGAPNPPNGQPAPAADPKAAFIAGHQAGQKSPQAHENFLVHGLKSILGGGENEYKVDENGNTVTTQQKRTPGALFRGILGGALLGMAGGAHEKSFAGGVGMGAAAEREHLESADRQKYERARQEFQDKIAADREKREKSAADDTHTHTLALSSLANAQTVEAVQRSQGESFKNHQNAVEADAPYIAMREEANVSPVAKNVSETEMGGYIQKNPGAASLDWKRSGVKTSLDKDGKPQYEYTFSAYDPNAKVKLTKGIYDQWAKDGMFDKDELTRDALQRKIGQDLTPDEYHIFRAKHLQALNLKLAQGKEESSIEENKARTREANAQAAHLYKESEVLGLTKKQSQQTSEAFKALDAAEGDPSKLTPSQRLTIAETAPKMLAVVEKAIKDKVDNGQDASDLMQERDHWVHLMGQSIKWKTEPLPKPSQPGAQLSTSDAKRYLAANNGDMQKAMDAAKKDGWNITAPEDTIPGPESPEVERRRAPSDLNNNFSLK